MVKGLEPWEQFYDGIRVIPWPAAVYGPDPVYGSISEGDLDEAESQLGLPLPKSYREFMKRFGPGQLYGHVSLWPPSPNQKSVWGSVVERTKELAEYWPQHADWHPNWRWVSRLIYFAHDGAGNEYAWVPEALIESAPSFEYAVYLLEHEAEDQPIRISDSFWKFVEWVCATIQARPDADQCEQDGPGLYFNPLFLRDNNAPRNEKE